MLDIGCGTGLLSMLAARAGAVEVYGCELYEPLAQIAREVTTLNCGEKIKARTSSVSHSVLFFVQRGRCFANETHRTQSHDPLSRRYRRLLIATDPNTTQKKRHAAYNRAVMPLRTRAVPLFPPCL